MILASLTSPALYLIGIFNVIYLLILVFAIAVFLICAISIIKDQSKKNTKIVSKRIKIGMGICFSWHLHWDLPLYQTFYICYDQID